MTKYFTSHAVLLTGKTWFYPPLLVEKNPLQLHTSYYFGFAMNKKKSEFPKITS